MSKSECSPSTAQSIKVNFIAGCVGLSSAFAAMHPVDTLKTRMQASVANSTTGINWKQVLNRDTLRVLSRGFVASVVGAGPQGGTRLATYELTKSYLLRPSTSSTTYPSTYPTSMLQHSLSPIPASAISAIVGDFASSIVKVPREVITSRLQTGHYHTSDIPSSSSPCTPSSNRGAIFAIRHIVETEGPLGLFHGFWSTMARDCPFMVILFVTYESFKSTHTQKLSSSSNSLSSNTQDICPIPTHTSTLYGGISGGLAGFFTTPFDVIKTRIMTFKAAPFTSAANPSIHKTIPDLSMRSIAYQIYSEQFALYSAPSSSSSSATSSSSSSSRSATAASTSNSSAKKSSPTRFLFRFPFTFPRFIPSIALFSSSASSAKPVVRMDMQKVYVETVKAFWRGAVPRSAWWFCVCSIFFPVYEGVKNGLSDEA